MTPYLANGTWAVFRRRTSREAAPRRFQVVRFEDPRRPAAWAVKRVAGLPGEIVELRAGRLIVDGTLLAEAHASGDDDGAYEWKPGSAEIVVLGDNRSRSTDSRHYGPIPLSAVRGRLVKR
jgi:signal peptidase I